MPVRYVPAWVPGTSFHQAAKAMRAELDALYDIPYNFVKSQRVRFSFLDIHHYALYGSCIQERGLALPSLVNNYLEDALPNLPFDKTEFIKAAAGSLYSGEDS
jgi:hypothetical protein